MYERSLSQTGDRLFLLFHSSEAAAPGDISYVVVEPVKAGSKAFIVASPVHVILSLAGIEFGDLDDSLAQAQLATLGFTFSDFDTVALRTT